MSSSSPYLAAKPREQISTNMATRAELEALHGKLVRALSARLDTNDLSASEYNAIRHMLKDNNIMLEPVSHTDAMLLDVPAFPFDDADEHEEDEDNST